MKLIYSVRHFALLYGSSLLLEWMKIKTHGRSKLSSWKCHVRFKSCWQEVLLNSRGKIVNGKLFLFSFVEKWKIQANFRLIHLDFWNVMRLFVFHVSLCSCGGFGPPYMFLLCLLEDFLHLFFCGVRQTAVCFVHNAPCLFHAVKNLIFFNRRLFVLLMNCYFSYVLFLLAAVSERRL